MKRPRVTLKFATSLDGRIALADGQSEWITGEAAREAGRRLRAEHDAIIIGSNTAVVDNPQLTTRIRDLPNPIRVVFDTRLRLPMESNLTQTADEVPVIVLTASEDAARMARYRNLGVTVVRIARGDDGLSVVAGLEALVGQGIRSALVEGGGALSRSFVSQGLVDRVEWFRAPIVLGGDSRPAVGPLRLNAIGAAPRLHRVEVRAIGDDLHESYEVD